MLIRPFSGSFYKPNYDSSYNGHGPAFVTITALLIKIVQSVFPNIFILDLWHFSYFITFQLTGLCLYWLTKRWLSKWASWGTLILFTTQPLLWGHAFINPKDIPFMFFFILSIVSGFRWADSINIKMKELHSSLGKPDGPIIKKFQEKKLKVGETVVHFSWLKIRFAEFFRALLNPYNIVAGVALGLATAVRPIAPLAGVIVIFYLFIKIRSRAWITAVAYFLIAGVVHI